MMNAAFHELMAQRMVLVVLADHIAHIKGWDLERIAQQLETMGFEEVNEDVAAIKEQVHDIVAQMRSTKYTNVTMLSFPKHSGGNDN